MPWVLRLAIYDSRIFGIVNSDLKVEVLNPYENSSRWSEFPITKIATPSLKLTYETGEFAIQSEAKNSIQISFNREIERIIDYSCPFR